MPATAVDPFPFQPVIEEPQEYPAPGGHLEYLRLEPRGIMDKTVAA